MNIASNMEFIFVAATVLIGATSYAGAAIPAHHAMAHAAPAAKMAVVHISAKRLSAAEKVRAAE